MTQRMAGLDERARRAVVAAAAALDAGRVDEASALLAPALAVHPDHPEVLRMHAGTLGLRGYHGDALEQMRRALAQRPDDPAFHNTYGTLLGQAGDYDGAVAALRRACELQPTLANGWYNLGVMLTRCVRNEQAAEALQRAVTIAPDHMEARALLADLLRMRGQSDQAAEQYRRVLAERPWSGMAWWGLADLRTGAFDAADVAAMQAALRHARATDDDRIATGFALAAAFDQAERPADALAALAQANALARHRQQWNAAAFSAGVSALNAVFQALPARAPGALGSEVIFIVGLPRSGSTLVEQILASHSQVGGAGELPDVPLVLAEESRRRGQTITQWAGMMQPVDWEMLGRRYLERTAHWRRRRKISTDKLPGNWIYLGAIRAMLPGAHIIGCHRDPLETCFSCYRQRMENNEYTRRFEDLASFWRDYAGSLRQWSALDPQHVFEHHYERLLAEPAAQIERLLAACGLPYEAACLAFHENLREVRSPSANQVRQPLRRDTARAPRYGHLLDPLRRALGMPAWQA